MEQQTAMQAAIAHYKDLSEKGSNQAYVVAKFLEDNFLEMEKQQLIDATTHENIRCTQIANTTLKILGLEPVFMVDDTWGEHYYNNTFKND